MSLSLCQTLAVALSHPKKLLSSTHSRQIAAKILPCLLHSLGPSKAERSGPVAKIHSYKITPDVYRVFLCLAIKATHCRLWPRRLECSVPLMLPLNLPKEDISRLVRASRLRLQKKALRDPREPSNPHMCLPSSRKRSEC